MIIELQAAGEVVERQELLNGTQSVTIEGADGVDAWTLVGSASWNRGLREYAGEGDLALTRGSDGAEVFATVTHAERMPGGDGDEGDVELRLEYDVDGGSGAFESVVGTGVGTVRLTGATFEGEWRFEWESAPGT